MMQSIKFMLGITISEFVEFSHINDVTSKSEHARTITLSNSLKSNVSF
jgi:hypothetical protein